MTDFWDAYIAKTKAAGAALADLLLAFKRIATAIGDIPVLGKVLSLDDPRAWAETIAFPQDKPQRRAVKEHLLRHPTVGVKSIPVLYKFGVQWDSRDCLSPA